MLAKYLSRFGRSREGNDFLSEENFERIYALSSELLLTGRTVAVTGAGIASMGRGLTRLKHKLIALETVGGQHRVLQNAGLISETRALNGTRMDLEPESCDVLVSGLSFLGAVSRPLFLKEVARVLRPGGQCLLLEANAKNAAAVSKLQKQLGLPAADVTPCLFEDIKHFGEAYFEWNMPYRFPFSMDVQVFLGNRKWNGA